MRRASATLLIARLGTWFLQSQLCKVDMQCAWHPTTIVQRLD